MTRDLVVMVKGAGETASGVAWRLVKSHFKVVLTEIQQPLAAGGWRTFSRRPSST